MKHKIFPIVLVATLMALVAFVAWTPQPAVAAPAPLAAVSGPTLQDDVPLPPDVLNIVLLVMVGFASLVGVSKLIAALINVLKLVGVVKDGTAARWSAGLNLAAFIGLVLAGVFRPDMTMQILDGYAGQIASALLFILGFVSQIVGSASAHGQLSDAKVPLIGTSFSKDA